MRIGATLADARWRAHLTVDEVSHRTRIREAIIWGIEQDDFSACGGDAYARGHIRAIAQAVDIDPDPLIQQYDETYRASEDIEDVVVLRPPPPVTPGRPPRPHRRRRLAVTTVLGVVVLALVGWAVDHVVSGASPGHDKALAVTGHASSHPASGAAAAGQGSPVPSPAPSAVPTTPSPSPSPTPPPSAPPAPASHALTVAGAVPFGPGGEGSGDNPQSAAAAIDSSSSTGWHSDWYTSAALGNLKPGTGLLLDMGRRVTINDAELNLGGFSGAGIQLRAGNEPSVSGLHEVASESGAGGTVQLNLKKAARAKYLLIWFTQLPPDASGTYQAGVYHVIVRGHS